jgi:hypothetical protein
MVVRFGRRTFPDHFAFDDPQAVVCVIPIRPLTVTGSTTSEVVSMPVSTRVHPFPSFVPTANLPSSLLARPQ